MWLLVSSQCGPVWISEHPAELNYPASTLTSFVFLIFWQTNIRVLLNHYLPVTAHRIHFIFQKQTSESTAFSKYIPVLQRVTPSVLRGVFAWRWGS